MTLSPVLGGLVPWTSVQTVHIVVVCWFSLLAWGAASAPRSPPPTSPSTRPGTWAGLCGEGHQFFCRWPASSELTWETDVGSRFLLWIPVCPSRVPCLCCPLLCIQLFLPPALLTCRDFRLQPDAEAAGFTDSTSFSWRPWLVTFSFASNRPLPDLCLLSSSHNYAMSNPCREFLISYHSQQFCFSAKTAHTVFSSRPFNT